MKIETIHPISLYIKMRWLSLTHANPLDRVHWQFAQSWLICPGVTYAYCCFNLSRPFLRRHYYEVLEFIKSIIWYCYHRTQSKHRWENLIPYQAVLGSQAVADRLIAHLLSFVWKLGYKHNNLLLSKLNFHEEK